ncbi:MAG: DNRLRE domain-containing protein [Candidatus Omnitrophota bacterium]
MRRVFKVFVIGLVVVFFAVMNARAESLVLQPGAEEGKDANWYSYPGNSNNYNFGGLNCFEITNNRSFQGRGLLRFDLPSELAGKDIQSATLSLYAYDTAYNGDNVIYIDRATSSWEESPAGTLFTPPSYDTLYQSSSVISLSSYSWVDFNITDMVNFWVSNSDNNYGMVLVTDDTNYNKSVYSYAFSSDYSNPSWRPKLSIEYSSSVAPEPASFILFGIGAITAIVSKRKKQSKNYRPGISPGQAM